MAEPEDGYGGVGERGGGAGIEEESGDTTGATRAGYARTQTRARMSEVRGQVREKADELGDQVREKVGELKEQATERADEMASRAGTRVSGIARALRRAGEELRTEGDERLASITDDFAGQIDRLGSYLDGEKPERMLHDLERMAKNNPAFFVGGTFAAGLLFGRFLRSDEPKADVDIEFEPDGDWGDDEWDGPETDGRGPAVGVIDEGPYAIGGDRDPLEETPDLHQISADHPSQPRVHINDETPVRTPIAGHGTSGPGIRTGSSGAAALDAGSAGPRQGEGSTRGDGSRSGGEGER